MTWVGASLDSDANPTWTECLYDNEVLACAAAASEGDCDFIVGPDPDGSVLCTAISSGLLGLKPTLAHIQYDGVSPISELQTNVSLVACTTAMPSLVLKAIDSDFEAIQLTRAPRLARVKCDPDVIPGDSLRIIMMEGAPHADYITLAHFDEASHAARLLLNAPTATTLAWAETVRRCFIDEVDAALEQTDALVVPALPSIPQSGTAENHVLLARFLLPFNFSGHPTIVLPIPIGQAGLPSGIQIIGRQGDDANLCAIAEWIVGSFASFQQEKPST